MGSHNPLSEEQVVEILTSSDSHSALAAEPVAEGPTDEELLSLDYLRESWNAQADYMNNWDQLGTDEIIWWAQRQALARWGHQPAPPAEGEVRELVRQLGVMAADAEAADYVTDAAVITRATPEHSISEAMTNTITVNGIDYIRADSVPAAQPDGNRAVIVVDRGWIFAGDVTRENGRIRLDRAVWVFRWESCGFAKVIEDPSKADIRPMANVDIPDGAEIFCVPVSDNWGLS